jgi:PAS domain S-box-containing protein
VQTIAATPVVASPRRLRGFTRRAVQVLALGAVYAVVGHLGLTIAPVHSFASLVWPPTGISLAAVLLGGSRFWPGVAIGAFLVNAWAGASGPIAVGIAVGNTLEAVLGAHLIRRAGGPTWSLERLRGMLVFIVLGALVSTLVSASVGVSSLWAGERISRTAVLETWRVWWLGDAVGALVIGSLLLAWTGSKPSRIPARRLVEALVLGTCVIAGTVLIFFRAAVVAPAGFIQACMLIPLLIAGALRFGVRGGTGAVFVACAIAVAGSGAGRGPFAQGSIAESLLYLQAFMAVVAAAVLVVGAITAERADAMHQRALGERALREREDELRLITGVTPLMLTRCSRDLRYRFVNRAYARMIGQTPEQIIGRPIVEIMGTQGFEGIRAYVETVLQGQTVEYEDEVYFEGVGRRSLRVVYVPDVSNQGDVVGWVASIVDITERKRAEAEVRSLAQFPEENPNPVMRALTSGELLYANRPARELLHGMGWQSGPLPEVLLHAVQRVPAKGTIRELEVSSAPHGTHVFTLSRSAGEGHVNLFGLDITDRKHAEDALRDADQRKNEFLGVLSHELRNPLAPIRNALHLLRDGPKGDERSARAVAVIERQTNQLTRLVDDLLDVARISRGLVQIQHGRIELTRVVEDTVEDHRSVFDARRVTLRVSIDPGPLWVDGDAARLKQIVGNLLLNAAKFTNVHGRVEVILERADPAHAVFRVADDGIGIDPEVLPNIFEAFTQADDTLDRSFGGLGLGLTLVKALVEMHGGRVEARSAGLGHGVEVTVSLPLVRDVGVVMEAPQRTPRASRARQRVLVIEDNVDAAETLREGLEMNDHDVSIAHDGEEGLAKVLALKPEIVICDIGLPGLDGYEVARRIRADSGCSPTLIALTGYALPQDRAKAFEAGFDHHLAKPCEMSTLENLLATLSSRL